MPLDSSTPGGVALCLTAVAVGAAHALLGPDHDVPFVALARAGDWALGKTLRLTIACGLAHVAGSVLFGLGLGLEVMRFGALEAVRRDMAAWPMIGRVARAGSQDCLIATKRRLGGDGFIPSLAETRVDNGFRPAKPRPDQPNHGKTWAGPLHRSGAEPLQSVVIYFAPVAQVDRAWDF